MKPSEFQALVEKQAIVIDGAMGTMVQNYGFGPEIYGGEIYQMLSDLLVFSRPDAVKEIHLAYFRAGSNAVETNTFGASPLRLQEFDLSGIDLTEYPTPADGVKINELSIEEFTLRMNREAVGIAKQAIAEYKLEPEYDGRPLFVLGSIGPSNFVLTSTHADLNKGTFEQIEDNFYLQVKGLIQGGVDVILFETQQDMLETKAAVFGAQRAMKEMGEEVAIICQVTVDQFSRMQIFHTEILAALVTLQAIGISAFGINCSIGPDLMKPTVELLSRHSKIPISVIPNAGLPVSENGETVYKLGGEDMAKLVKEFVVDYGVSIIGGCCGTSPLHIKAIADAVRGVTPKPRVKDEGVYISGPQKAVLVDGQDSLIRIGERLNVRGSKKVRDAVESGGPIDHDALEEVISEQVKDLGAEIIDVCMDSNIVNTTETLVNVIQNQTVDFSAAMCLDSFDVGALAEAIKVYPGRPIVNSISMEEYEKGVDKVDAVLEVTKAHSPLYIALTTGPKGPAVTKEEKLELATEIIEKAVHKHGCKVEQFLVDINAFPIGSESEEGMNFALESIKSIPMIKAKFPDVRTTIGVGNLTNGLAKKPYMRKVLTSVFLDEARKVGLDAAIINPNHYVPVESLPEADYKLGLQIVMERDMDAFTALEEIAEQKVGGVVKKKTNYDDLGDVEGICLKIKEGFKEREKGEVIFKGVTYEYIDKIVLQVARVLETGIAPLVLVNDHLMVAMEELGAGFAEGMVSLPHLLKSADVMKQVMGFLEASMKGGKDAEEEKPKGTIVLGTVYQDVHSIGKDLTKTLMENYGYRVIDLGVQVPLEEFIEVALREKADIIGMSALLVQTSNHMITLAKMLKEFKAEHLTLMIGGAPVNLRHAAFVAQAAVEGGQPLKGDVFYCNSAMDGVNVLNSFFDPERREKFIADNQAKLEKALEVGEQRKAAKEELFATLPMRAIKEVALPAGMINTQTRSFTMGIREASKLINRKNLFTLNWKYGGKQNWEKRGVSEEILEKQLQEWIDKIEANDWFEPQVAYRFVPCKREGQVVQVLEKGEEANFQFNPVLGQGNKDQFNFADFFHSQVDVIGVQLTTAGKKSEAAVQEVGKEDSEFAWILQGIADRIAEDLAEHVQGLMEHELKIALLSQRDEYKGLRCSPGYPAMTDLQNNRVIFNLLNAGKTLGISMTEGNQFDPTSSTGAVVCFHPDVSFN